nr:hypothetical protein [Tanacetum cinerariifolium]
MVEQVNNEVEKDFLIEKKLREMCLELIKVHKKEGKEIEELGKRTGDPVAEGDARMVKKRNVEYPRALLHSSIAQDKRTTTKCVV